MSTSKLCNLCPRKCNIDRKKSFGFCKQSYKIKIARAALHFDEEPCVSGTKGSGTVFFSGCPLNCVYCQNHLISHINYGKSISVKRLSEIFLELQKQGALNINLVSPTHFVDKIILAIKLVKKRLNIPIIYNTSGYENIETLKMCENYIDIYLTDIKYYNCELSKKYSSSTNYFEVAFSAFSEMLKQKPLVIKDGIIKQGVILRHLVLPNNRLDSINILKQVKNNIGTENFILSLMSQYTPNGHLEEFSEIDRKITSFEYKSVVNSAIELGFKCGYIQDLSSAKKIYTPPFDLTGVLKENLYE